MITETLGILQHFSLFECKYKILVSGGWRYSRMDQVKFVEYSLADHIT